MLRREDLRRLAWTLLAVAAFVAGLGLVDVYAVSIGWWRTNGVIDYFHRHLGYDYHGTGTRLDDHGAVYGLPENFIYNVGGDKPFLRRLVSTFLSPLASGYLFVVALLVAVAAMRRRALALALGVVTAAGLLWTFSRSSLAALAVGLVVLAAVRAAVPSSSSPPSRSSRSRSAGRTSSRRSGRRGTGRRSTARISSESRRAARRRRSAATSSNEPSLHSHWASLKDGVRTMIDHPQGYGLGNVGQTASRTGTPLKAGESNYTELGVELGVLGAVLWLAFGLALLAGLVRAGRDDLWAAGLAAAFAAVLALAVQTDVIGDPWIAYCIWGLGGALTLGTRPQERLARANAPAVAS